MEVVEAMGITGVPLDPYSSDQLEGAIDAEDILEGMDPTDKPFFSIGEGLFYWWNQNIPYLESYLIMAEYLGAPIALTNIFRSIWRGILILMVVSFISGRDFLP